MTEPREDHVLEGIQRELEADGHVGMVLHYALVVAWVDEDGDHRIMGSCMDDQRAHITLGLLQFGVTIEQDRICREWRSAE